MEYCSGNDHGQHLSVNQQKKKALGLWLCQNSPHEKIILDVLLYFDKYPDLVLSYFVLNKLINNQINKSDLWRCIRWALFSCYKTCLSDNNHISLFSDWLFPPQYMPELRPCWYFPFQKSFKAFQMGNHDNLVLTFNRIYSCSASRLRVCYL